MPDAERPVQPGEQQAGRFRPLTEEGTPDTEGHGARYHPAQVDDQPPNDDTQGHGGKLRPFTPDADESAQPGEQKAIRGKGG